MTELIPLADRGDLRDVFGEPLSGAVLRTLLGTVERTDSVRHGRSPISRLTGEDVEALLALDKWPGLLATGEEMEGRDIIRCRAADEDEQARAGDYLELLYEELGEEELERRAKAAKGIGSPAPGDVGHDPQVCPVCGYETLAVVATDDWGYDIGAGTCAVCSYSRSPALLWWLGEQAEYERKMARDD